jgi:Zn-dependent membrane protease YugP
MLEDPLFWVFVLPGLLLGLYAQSRIKFNVTKYSQVRTQNGITGAEVARRLLDAQGLQNVAVESTPGVLSDHYDPRSKTLRLSQQVYFAPSVAAAGIAAHEAGHALQDADDYFPWRREHILDWDACGRARQGPNTVAGAKRDR